MGSKLVYLFNDWKVCQPQSNLEVKVKFLNMHSISRELTQATSYHTPCLFRTKSLSQTCQTHPEKASKSLPAYITSPIHHSLTRSNIGPSPSCIFKPAALQHPTPQSIIEYLGTADIYFCQYAICLALPVATNINSRVLQTRRLRRNSNKDRTISNLPRIYSVCLSYDDPKGMFRNHCNLVVV